jgi:glycosyltransferase involved in cell wall biosynthesis
MTPKKLKIAHVVLSLDIGGLETLIVDMLRHLDRERFDAVVVCIRGKGVLAEQIESLGVRVYGLGGKDRMEWGAFFKLARILRKEKVYIVHCHNTAGYFYGGIAAVLAGFKRIIYTEHGRVFPDTPRHMLAERILSWITYKIIAVSEDMKQCLIRYEKIAPSKIQVIYNGVDDETYKKREDREWRMEKRRQFGIGENDIVIGNVARLDPVKDHECLIRAFALIKQKIKQREEKIEKQFKLLIVGFGSEFDHLKELCRNLALDFFDHSKGPDCSIIYPPFSILFLGSRTDISDLMNIMDVFALSSKNEGISLTLLEAMACGVPVVATRVGGNPEIVKDGENGFLCKPGDPQDLADKIFSVLSCPLSVIHCPLSIKEMINQYEALYART